MPHFLNVFSIIPLSLFLDKGRNFGEIVNIEFCDNSAIMNLKVLFQLHELQISPLGAYR